MARDSAIFYRSFYEAIDNLPSKSQKEQVYSAIFDFIFKNIEPELKGNSLSVWILIKPQLIANQIRYENGSRSKTEAKPKRTASEIQANKNVFNVNEECSNDNVIASQLEKLPPPSFETFFSFCKTLADYKPNMTGPVTEKFNRWNSNNWINGYGKPIDNWQNAITEVIKKLKKEHTPQKLSFSMNSPRKNNL